MKKNDQKQAFSDYFRLIKFNLFCLSKSIFLIIFSIIFYLIPISFVLICHFLGHNIASISWIYLIIIGFFVLIFINIGIYLLYHLNKDNSVDTFFMTKGYKSTHLLFSKLLSILFIILFNSLVNTIILIILLSSFSYFNQIASFVLMQFIGCFVTGLMLFPIFLIFSFIKNKVIYASLTFCFFLLPALSIIPRMQTNNIPNMSVYNPNNGYNKIYDVITNKSYNFSTVNNIFQEGLFNEFAWSVMPAELMFSPLYYTYQVNNNYIDNDLAINLDFISNINNIDFNEDHDYVNFNANNSLFLRPLDTNIYESSNSDANKLISNAVSDVYKYATNELKLTDQKFSDMRLWSTPNSEFDAYSFVSLLEKMFLSSNTTLFYAYQLIKTSINSTNSILKDKANIYKKAILNACSNDASKTFIASTLETTSSYNTVLDYGLIKYRVTKTYPTGLNIINEKANSSDVKYLIDNCFDLTGSSLNMEKINLKWTRFIKTTGYISEGKIISFNFNDFKQYFIKNYRNQAMQIFGEPYSPNDSFFNQFILNDDVQKLIQNKDVSDFDNWTTELFKAFLYLLSGNDYINESSGIKIEASDIRYVSSDNTSVWGSYNAINIFIEGLNAFLNQDSFKKEINNQVNQDSNLTRGYINIETFSFDPNNNENPNYNNIIKQYGKLRQQTYNNLLISSLMSTSISIIAYIWIIYFIIQKSKTKND